MVLDDWETKRVLAQNEHKLFILWVVMERIMNGKYSYTLMKAGEPWKLHWLYCNCITPVWTICCTVVLISSADKLLCKISCKHISFLKSKTKHLDLKDETGYIEKSLLIQQKWTCQTWEKVRKERSAFNFYSRARD